MPLQTLRRMAAGGIYDQVGGGFARYSVDAHWLVPHFEKMLYDNALLARAYLHAFQVSGEALFRRVCEETLDWAMRELRQDEGGFASSLGRRLRGRRGQVLRLDAGRDRCGARRRARGRRGRRISESPREGTSKGATSSCGRRRTRRELAEIKAGLLAARARAGAAGAGRQAADELERADDLGAGRRGRGAWGGPTTWRPRVACASFIEAELRDGVGRAPAHVQPRPREAAGVPGGPRVPARGVPDAVRVDVRRALVRRARSRSPT